MIVAKSHLDEKMFALYCERSSNYSQTFTPLAMSEANALEIPQEVEGDPKATEIARIWAAHGKQHVHLRSGLCAPPRVVADLESR